MNHKLLESTLVFTCTAVVLTWLIVHFEALFLGSLISLMHVELKFLLPAFHLNQLAWNHDHHETLFVMVATLAEYKVILGFAFPPGTLISVSTPAAHAWVHPVMLLSLLTAWPSIPWKKKPVLLLIGIPFVLLAEFLDVPFMLWGALEDFLYWQVAPASVSESLGSFVQHFLDAGGRFVLPILFSLLAVELFRRLNRIGPKI